MKKKKKEKKVRWITNSLTIVEQIAQRLVDKCAIIKDMKIHKNKG